MHILIATTGVLSPGPVVDLCTRLLGEAGRATVMTVMEVPRSFLERMDDDERRSFLDDRSWQTDSAERKALSYLEERGRRAVEPVVAALRSYGYAPEVRFVEGRDPADAIVKTATEIGADLVMLGATKRLFTEQAWSSVSAQVMERTQRPLILVPGLKEPEPPRVMPQTLD